MAAPRAIQQAHDGPDARLACRIPAGVETIVLGSRAAGSEVIYVADGRAYYQVSSYDDYACWTAPLTDELLAILAELRASLASRG
jgi:hypothetical protein